MRQSVYATIKKLISGSAQPMYVYRSDHTVIDDFSQFSGIPTDEIERRIHDYKELSKMDWTKTPGATFRQKANLFYGGSENYIFDLLSANYSKDVVVNKLNRFTPRILDSIKNHPGKEFLEFGGGTGVFCDVVAHLGKHVTYLDVAGRTFDFAKWRFEKYNIPVRMICSNPERLELQQGYDIIFTDAVVEHLPAPQSVIQELCRHTKRGAFSFHWSIYQEQMKKCRCIEMWTFMRFTKSSDKMGSSMIMGSIRSVQYGARYESDLSLTSVYNLHSLYSEGILDRAIIRSR